MCCTWRYYGGPERWVYKQAEGECHETLNKIKEKIIWDRVEEIHNYWVPANELGI